MKKASPNITTILLIGMMLLVLAIITVLANKNKKQEADEIVFEPVEVLIDGEIEEGSAMLKIEYDTEDTIGFDSKGEEVISLEIIKDEDNPNQFTVKGSLSSTQTVRIAALDQGNTCWFNIFHNVDYSVKGTFTASTCQFKLFVKMPQPSDSALLSNDCSVDINLDPSRIYMAPPKEKLVFTKSFAGPALSSLEYSLFLFDVTLPSGVNCPAFNN